MPWIRFINFFVIKFSYRYVMVCSVGKTVEFFYKIKSDYGSENGIAAYNVRKLICISEKVPKCYCKITSFKDDVKDIVDSIIGCKVWLKSHSYVVWMLSAIIREFVEKFIQYSPLDCHQTIKGLTEQCEKTVDCISQVNKLSQEVKSRSYVKNALTIFEPNLRECEPSSKSFQTI